MGGAARDNHSEAGVVGNYMTMMVGILGTTISPYLFFWQASQEVEEERAQGKTLAQRKGATGQELRALRTDVLTGMFFSNFIMYFIILTTGATLHAHGITQIDTAKQAAEALRPLAGNFAYLLFTLGLIGTGMLGVPVLAVGGLCDCRSGRLAGFVGEETAKSDKILRGDCGFHGDWTGLQLFGLERGESIVLVSGAEWCAGSTLDCSDPIADQQSESNGRAREFAAAAMAGMAGIRADGRRGGRDVRFIAPHAHAHQPNHQKRCSAPRRRIHRFHSAPDFPPQLYPRPPLPGVRPQCTLS